MASNDSSKVNVLMVGTGEYTTGYVGGKAADSDKGAGVVALTMFDLRRRNKVDRIGMCGVNVRTSYLVDEWMIYEITTPTSFYFVLKNEEYQDAV